jgi:hypothetical protein
MRFPECVQACSGNSYEMRDRSPIPRGVLWKMQEKYNQGWTVALIAKTFGFHYHKVYRALNYDVTYAREKSYYVKAHAVQPIAPEPVAIEKTVVVTKPEPKRAILTIREALGL